MNYPNYNLTGKYPGLTYQNLVQYAPESSSLVDGMGNVLTGSLNMSASYSLTASYALNGGGVISNTVTQSLFSTQSLYSTQSIYANSASWVSASVLINSASYSLTASFLTQNRTYNVTSSWSVSSLSSSYNVGTVVNGTYVMGAPLTLSPTSLSGTITITNGIITAVQQAT